MLRRVLIANRGEIAVRVIRACRELGIGTVAVYSTADRESLHVHLADRAICIGPPAAAESYLNIAALIGAARTAGADAVHPGYGFLAENASFARACEEHGLLFVGPRAESIELMGDKARARAAMDEADLPIVPGSGRLGSAAEARRFADEVGFPVLLKASAGGGGRGMRLVAAAGEIDQAFSAASAEAEKAFSDGSLYVEKAIERARHVEIQVLCDGEGGVLTLGERDCSIQRRHQKLIEESPSPGVSPALRDRLEDAAARACSTIGYRGAGTLEFLVSGEDFYFIEMNTRLQVEHPVTELVTGVDLVRGQLSVAAGESLPATGRADRRGHAIEIRINAEDPRRGFLPAPGRITRFRAPLGAGVRVDTHVFEGYDVPPYYDSLLAKLIVVAEERRLALARAAAALTELELDGLSTTRGLAIEILGTDAFREGRYTTAYLDENAGTLETLRES
ncbi:MAG: acetyl-CoA carboxylase biotin carboxylase subunit [Gaiellales bacterium]